MTQEAQVTALLARRAAQVQQGGARAAVLGVNDGLVSTLCLVLAVAGAGSGAHAVRLAGLAGLLAGAVSMAAGEWISVKAQVELFQGVLADLRDLVRDHPSVLGGKLEDTFRTAGFSPATASGAAAEVAADGERLYAASAREVVGVNPAELGSPWTAALSSFALFALGSAAPLLPWLVADGTVAVVTSIGLTGLAGLAVGGVVAHSSGRPVRYGALRQLLIILLSSGVTYGAGVLFGTV
ncbi:VIT family protein [Actinomadura rubteroloni]|uniref:VIT family protein n=1 Tax=Actinomadura rubteroloni TaxID=1926885 RepID=A0A2P4UB37_9ACTN|nr:VIT1/CCC1 transporter family protein [Actinomadura rubteroloni]POM22259.1 VIT family protein [Actinomadura rubteroloni]